MLNSKILPERCIGRTGSDFFSSHKDLTVIMIPFERFSCFAKAVDDLYKSIDVPFNLIVVEGNAPESVRHALERRQKKYKNITIIYSERHISTGAAINLAVPHLNTQYAFLMDDEMRIPPYTMSKLLQCARENNYGIVCPQNYVLPKPLSMDFENENISIQGLDVHTCFLITQAALQKLGKLDESMTPCTAGIDIRLAADLAGISITSEMSAFIGCDREDLIMPMDAELHSFQWNPDRVYHSIEKLTQKWGINFQKKSYSKWLDVKKRALRNSKSRMFFLTWINSKLKMMNYEKQPVSMEELYLSKVA